MSRLFMTLLVRDEEDIVAATLDFHLSRGVEHVIVTDNASRDATREILDDYERRGLVSVIDEPADDYAQGAWVTRMARMAAERGASWVINADADEFWWPLEGSLAQTLDATPPDVSQLAAQRLNFVPTRDETEPFWERMTWRELESLTFTGRRLPGKVCHRAHPKVVVKMGNHKILEPDLGEPVDAPIEILHFPLRTYAQLRNKVERGAAAIERNPELSPRQGIEWRRMYRMLKRGRLEERYLETVLDRRPPDTVVEDLRLREAMTALQSSG